MTGSKDVKHLFHIYQDKAVAVSKTFERLQSAQAEAEAEAAELSTLLDEAETAIQLVEGAYEEPEDYCESCDRVDYSEIDEEVKRNNEEWTDKLDSFYDLENHLLRRFGLIGEALPMIETPDDLEAAFGRLERRVSCA